MADFEFAAEVEAAMEAATDLLEDEARRRAMEQSDLLLIFLLRSRRPHIYNRKTIMIGGDPNNPIAVDHAHHEAPRTVKIYRLPYNGRDAPPDDIIEAEELVEDPLSAEPAVEEAPVRKRHVF